MKLWCASDYDKQNLENDTVLQCIDCIIHIAHKTFNAITTNNWQSTMYNVYAYNFVESTVTCDASHDSCGVVTLQVNSKVSFLINSTLFVWIISVFFLSSSVSFVDRWLPVLHFCYYTQNWKCVLFFTKSAGICTDIRI